MGEKSGVMFYDGLSHYWLDVYKHDENNILCDNCGCLPNDKKAKLICPKSPAGSQLADRDKRVKELEAKITEITNEWDALERWYNSSREQVKKLESIIQKGK